MLELQCLLFSLQRVNPKRHKKATKPHPFRLSHPIAQVIAPFAIKALIKPNPKQYM